MSPPEPLSTKRVRDATCLACGCLCDDIGLHVVDGRIEGVERACPIGEPWFLAKRPVDRPVCLSEGRPATIESGCRRAAEILSAAENALVIGLSAATCEAQRAALAIAEHVHGIAVVGSEASAALTAAVQSVGLVSATLGEVRHRADLVIFWGVDPATTHPRHFERYSLHAAGRFVPNGRADRFCVAIDCHRTPTADIADRFLLIEPRSDAAAMATLQALADGNEADAAAAAARTGVELPQWQALLERMKSARYGAVFFDPAAPAADLESLLRLTREWNRRGRLVAVPLGAAGNAAGAEQVATWRTGVAANVDFSAGSPRPASERGALAALHDEVDAALLVACDRIADPIAALSQAARHRLAAIPTVALCTADFAGPAVTVGFTVAAAGIDAAGTIFRSDGVPLPLRANLASPYPTAESVLQRIAGLLRSRND